MYIKNFYRFAYSNGIKSRRFYGFLTILAAFRNSNGYLRRKAANV